jgi:pimeloyl-ACP methyl ester carboxylesterase
LADLCEEVAVRVAEPAEVWGTSRQTALRMCAYDAGPRDPAVVVLHGLTTGVDVLRQTVPGLDPYRRLAAEGLNVLALDWRWYARASKTVRSGSTRRECPLERRRRPPWHPAQYEHYSA